MKVRLTIVSSVIACVGGFFAALGAEPPSPLELRQRIIRVAEDDLLKALEKKPGDEALAKQILQWVESGSAKVVSDLSTTATRGNRFETKKGEMYKWVVENDQDFDAPVLTPTDWRDVFLGASLEGDYRPEQFSGDVDPRAPVPGDPFAPGGTISAEDIPGGKHALAFTWQTETRAQMASKVRWPLVWPENKKPQVGWYEQDDFLVQGVLTTARLQPGHDAIVALIPPARDLETEPHPRELDVVLVRASSDKAQPLPPIKAVHVATPRVMMHGFGVQGTLAMELLAARDINNDAALLAKLHSLAREGKVARRVICGVQTASGTRTTIESVREHSYPTEMPTIPSAWSMRPVGTRVELDPVDRFVSLSFEHHPARFRWAEWACALDAPELIMKQPQFFVQRVETGFQFPQDNNVVLVAAMRTPECLKGSDKGPVIGETLLLFAELNQPAGTPPLKSWTTDPALVFVDMEAMIFDLPASEEDDWTGVGIPDAVDDELRFQKALARVKDGTARVACHLVVAAQTGRRSTVKTVEEVLIVTEYNPVDHNPTGRYRPTAIDMEPMGSSWEVDVGPLVPPQFAQNGVPMISLNFNLRHDALPAVQPTLKEALKYTQDHLYELPRATFTKDEWLTSVHLYSGKARCLGAVQPKSARFQDRIHVAFVRGVVRK